jgi:hypothetical protein
MGCMLKIETYTCEINCCYDLLGDVTLVINKSCEPTGLQFPRRGTRFGEDIAALSQSWMKAWLDSRDLLCCLAVARAG